jgi:hypothetical protein
LNGVPISHYVGASDADVLHSTRLTSQQYAIDHHIGVYKDANENILRDVNGTPKFALPHSADPPGSSGIIYISSDELLTKGDPGSRWSYLLENMSSGKALAAAGFAGDVYEAYSALVRAYEKVQLGQYGEAADILIAALAENLAGNVAAVIAGRIVMSLAVAAVLPEAAVVITVISAALVASWAVGELAEWAANQVKIGSWVGDMLTDLGAAMSLPHEPLVLDLDGDGIELTSLAGGTWFDLDGDAFAERAGWVGADDGLLAVDVNGNGEIDDISELFGDYTAATGFATLTTFDSNADGIINAADANFGQLKIWQDVNQNGISEASELKTLAEAGVASISLASVGVNQTVNGNTISALSTFTRTDNSTGTVAEAWFARDLTNSVYVGDFTLNLEALLLPKLRGYGQVADLTIAMSMDPTLLAMVQALTVPTANAATYAAAVEGILHRRAGIENVNPSSREWLAARSFERRKRRHGRRAYIGAVDIVRRVNKNCRVMKLAGAD